MKFGKVDNPEDIDFTLPKDHPKTLEFFNKNKQKDNLPPLYIGAPKWSKTALRNFYPKGTKDELAYYATQYNSIELNATFYQRYPPEQFEKWYAITKPGFMFFPKITQQISHYRQLKNVNDLVDEYLVSTSHLKDKLGTIFLQLNARYTPKHIGKLEEFVNHWPIDVKLAIEVRHEDWFADPAVYNAFCDLLESKDISNILVDTPGRRDMMHMRMTNARPFVRFVGAKHPSDFKRIDDWVERIKIWKAEGMQEMGFFIHQNADHESPLIAAYMIEKLNAELGYNMQVPKLIKQ